MIASLLLLIVFAVTIWVVEFVNAFTGHRFLAYGIMPRTVEGLRGIPLTPFLHAGFGHLMANTVPLLMLGGLAALRAGRRFIWVSLFIIAVGGLGVWVVGRTAIHVGASGLIFGYFGYLVATGLIVRSFLSVLVSIAVAILYGWGILFGVLPTAPIVSFEGHAFGLLAGCMVAMMTGGSRNKAWSG